MSTEKIDSLLQQYLLLLNEYTTLRNSLNTLQSSLYQHLARANFSAQPGVRYYGQDYYDERMQATSRLETALSSESSVPEFRLVQPISQESQHKGKLDETEQQSPDGKSTAAKSEPPNSPEDGNSNTTQDPRPADESKEGKNEDAKPKPKPQEKKKSNDPLRWFGILTPLPLRQAQFDAKKAVEDVIPQLANISEQMKALELEVRRERKKRAKAEKEEAKARVKELEEKVAAVEV